MLAIARTKLPLGIVIIAGGIGLNGMAPNAPRQVATNLAAAFGQTSLWLLLAVTALVVEFGRYMARPENSGAILSLARRWGGKHGRLWSLIAAPSIIGLVPMPAGALFSAPMVQQAADEEHWPSAWKAAINYWFRHIWEYWWPIYPVVIIGMAVFKMEAWQFMAALAAFTPATGLAGYFFLLRPHRTQLAMTLTEPTGDARRVPRIMLPLALIIASVLLLPPMMRSLISDAQIRKTLAMLIGMLTGMGLIAWEERGQSAGLFRAIFAKHSLNVLLTIGGVAVFQSLLESSGLLPQASRELLQSGIPLIPVVALLPFLAGLITGVASGFAGLAFPLVVGLLMAPGSGLTPMATLALAFGCGYIGMMLSPIHLCLLVTRDYFSASLLPIYRQILPCIAVMWVFTIGMFLLFKTLHW